MKIHIASDHAGYELKETLKAYITEIGHEVVDHGTNSMEPCDYPDFITPCAQAVAADTNSFGIILGGSGQGEAMCANRVSGARALEYYGGKPEIIPLGREHNNANILSLGARFVSVDEAKVAVKTFIESPFPGEERHVRRLAKF